MTYYETAPEGFSPNVRYQWVIGDETIRLEGCWISLTDGRMGIQIGYADTMAMIGDLKWYRMIEDAAWTQWCETGRAGVKQQNAEDQEYDR